LELGKNGPSTTGFMQSVEFQNAQAKAIRIKQLRRFGAGIVIPVVVGSSPISHPTEFLVKSKGCKRRLAALLTFLERGIPIFGT
jgi:hypothetical protein